MKTFNVYSDPEQGWMKVSVDDLTKIGLSANSFSDHSYYNDGHVYLETDKDAPIFIDAYRTKFGRFKFRKFECAGRSRVRAYYPITKIKSDDSPLQEAAE